MNAHEAIPAACVRVSFYVEKNISVLGQKRALFPVSGHEFAAAKNRGEKNKTYEPRTWNSHKLT